MKKIDLSSYTMADLVTLNRQVTERYNYLQQVESYKALSNLKVGDRVSFQTLEGRIVVGKITRLNKKTVSMTEDSNKMNWKVRPSLLTKVNSNKKETKNSNVVSFPSF